MPGIATETSPAASKGGFNYCRVSKAVVALPAWVAVAAIAAALFNDPWVRVGAACVAVVASYVIAVWIDRLPFLKKPVVVRGD